MTIKCHQKQLVKKPCPNHQYRSRTTRSGRLARFCSLCMGQEKMRHRWERIREALTVVSRSTRRSSSAGVTASASEARNRQQVTLTIPVIQPAVAHDLCIVVVVNCAQTHVQSTF